MSYISDTLKTAQVTIALAAPGSIGLAADTVDKASSIAVNYTGAANGAVTLANPTDAQAGDRVKVLNR